MSRSAPYGAGATATRRREPTVSARRAPVDEVARVLELFDTRYWDLTAKHFHENLVADHGFKRSYNWLRLSLQAHGRRRAAPRGGAHRRKRPRRALPGMMLHQDGSSHEWVPGRWWDLIVTMDDATSDIYSAFFVAEEGTMSSFQGVSEAIRVKGLFCSLYADRASHYWNTPEAGGKVDKDTPTQVGRALAQLGIELIPAYSPEARGRSERMFGTLQKRLPQELRLTGITDMAGANGDTEALTASCGTPSASRMLSSVSGPRASQRSCMVRVRRCRVLTDGVMPPIFAKNAAASRAVQ